MASVAVTNTFTASTTAVASEVNANFTDLVNYINNRNSASATWDAVSALSTSTTVLIADNSTGTNDIVSFKDNGTSVFKISDGGHALIKGEVRITDDGTDSFLYGGYTRGTGSFKIFASGGSASITIGATTGIQIGAPTGTDKGSGTINAASDIWVNGQIRLRDDGTDAFLYIGSARASGTFNLIASAGSNAFSVTSVANVVVGSAAIATTATNGFLYIPSCAGTPTGTPTTITGSLPLVIDSTNNKLYFYSGSWRDVGP